MCFCPYSCFLLTSQPLLDYLVPNITFLTFLLRSTPTFASGSILSSVVLIPLKANGSCIRCMERNDNGQWLNAVDKQILTYRPLTQCLCHSTQSRALKHLQTIMIEILRTRLFDSPYAFFTAAICGAVEVVYSHFEISRLLKMHKRFTALWIVFLMYHALHYM